MELTVLGCCGTYNAPKRACSSYLVTDKSNAIVIDLGNGAFANLLRHRDPFALDAVILTHAHADHIVDFFPLRYYLEILRKEGCEGKEPLPVYHTKKALERILCFIGDDSKERLKSLFDFRLIEPGEMSVDGFKIRFARVSHVDEAYAVRAETGAGSLAFTSDTSYDENLEEFSRGAAILMVDATYQGFAGKELMHMTSAEAGKLATGAGARKLVLTHLWPHLDEELSRKEAAEYFSGEVLIAREHMKIEV